MRKGFFTALCACLVLGASAQNKVLNYHPDGSFKILQITDNHYKPGNPDSEAAVELIREMIVAEKPDLIAFTGDLAWAHPAKEAYDRVLAPVIEAGVPWAFVFGNHDDEFEWSRQQIMDYLVQKPYCFAFHGDRSLKGVGNYTLELKNHAGDSVSTVLYFMDSGAYSRVKGIGGYDWFGLDQIQWYVNESKAYTRLNKGVPIHSLAFFHIPLPEYSYMTAAGDSVIVGTRGERECNGQLNSGMFAAMRTAGDVSGMFVGHDHDNDYIGEYYGIALAYGRYSGANTVYNNLGPTGCRVIVLKEGERGFKTHIRLRGGEVIHPVDFPQSFRK